MKTTGRTLLHAGSLASLIALAVWLTGCASSGYKQGDTAATNIRKAADRIDALPKEIERALGSLSDLVNNPQPDLKPQFKKFSSDVKRVEASAEHVQAARRSMAEKGQAFFDKWDEQLANITNEDIKARSQSRKEVVASRLMEVKVSYEQTEQAFKPFIADLRDIQTFLSIDLTSGGVEAARDPLKKAMQDAIPVTEAVRELAADFQALGLAMASVTPSE